jgi:nucleotide-binding universal stress UspA family protein
MVANPETEKRLWGSGETEKGVAMKRILVALDGSPPAHTALGQAAEWAARLGAELTGIFVEDEWRFVYYPTAASFEGGMSTPVPLPQDELEEENDKVKAEGDVIRTTFEQATKDKVPNATMVTVRGNVNEILIAEARAADLVVMGKRGRNDPPDSKKAGPTTEAIIHDALRPVLVVPEHGNTDGGALFAYDGSAGVQRVVVPGTILAKAKGQGATVITVGDDEAKANTLQGLIRKYLQAHGIDGVYQVVRGKPALQIVEAAQANNSGMIVMGAFGHGPIRQLVFGSATLSVLEHTPCPVLLMA